jgi:hypothetical protein
VQVVLPRISLLATIGLAYSVISPVINGLAVVSFFLFFLSWKFCTFSQNHKSVFGLI